jgi:predicted transcriptional regulator of viral defense system
LSKRVSDPFPGLYTLVAGDWTENHSLAETAKRVPGCVIGLASALRYHGLTNEMPHQVWVFISRKAWKPKVDYPALQIFRCEPERLRDDTTQACIEGTEVWITNVPRTITDCFRHRRAIGLDVAIRALREAIQHRLCTPADLVLVAKKHRAWNLMRPYLEAIL